MAFIQKSNEEQSIQLENGNKSTEEKELHEIEKQPVDYLKTMYSHKLEELLEKKV